METNNKMREALSKILVLAEYLQTRYEVPEFVANEISEIEQAAKAALAEPVKNCEVGTAEEQEKRFKENCGYGIPRCLSGCKVFKFALSKGLVGHGGNVKVGCEFLWAQMPYTEGGAK